MNRLIMMIGLPGCGKSTYAKKAIEVGARHNLKVFSSDEYRAKMLGDWRDQSANKKIFDQLYKDLSEWLKQGNDAILDATNVTKKDRSRAFELINILRDKYNLEIEVDAVQMVTPPSICLDRCILRENPTTWDEYKELHIKWSTIIDKMYNKYVSADFKEGFDYILVIV